MAKYQNKITITKTDMGKSYYTSALPTDPAIEQIQYQHTTRMGDRWDTIAYKYLGNAALWYVIANANNSINGSMFIKPGTLITIPQIY